MAKRGRTDAFTSGSTVWIPAEVRPGMFPDERFVRFETESTTVSGFVPAQTTKEVRGHGHVRAVVIDGDASEGVRLLISGEILTATNPVLVPRRWLARLSPESSK